MENSRQVRLVVILFSWSKLSKQTAYTVRYRLQCLQAVLLTLVWGPAKFPVSENVSNIFCRISLSQLVKIDMYYLSWLNNVCQTVSTNIFAFIYCVCVCVRCSHMCSHKRITLHYTDHEYWTQSVLLSASVSTGPTIFLPVNKISIISEAK